MLYVMGGMRWGSVALRQLGVVWVNKVKRKALALVNTDALTGGGSGPRQRNVNVIEAFQYRGIKIGVKPVKSRLRGKAENRVKKE